MKNRLKDFAELYTTAFTTEPRSADQVISSRKSNKQPIRFNFDVRPAGPTLQLDPLSASV